MKVSRTRVYTVKLQDYESHTFGATVEYTHHDFGYTDERLAKMSDAGRAELRTALKAQVAEELDDLLAEDIEEAQRLSNFRKSVIHEV